MLVELDSASKGEKLDEQILRHQKAVSALTQANAKYKNQILQNQTRQAEAELKVELNKLELEMYQHEDVGTYKLAKDDIERDISEQNNMVVEKRQQVKLNEIEMAAIQQLYNLGYRGRNDVDLVRLKLLQAEDALAAATNNMQSFQSRRGKLDTYERRMQVKTLEGALQTSERSLQQVIENNLSDLAQVEAARWEAESIAKKENERLENYRSNSKSARSTPHTVAWWSTPVKGVTARRRLPKVSSSARPADPHTSGLVPHAGQNAGSRGRAGSGACRPAGYHSCRCVPGPALLRHRARSRRGSRFFRLVQLGVKMYDCVVRIDGEVTGLKPGMTAVVEIHVDH